jgi:hypothetical protein
MLELLEEQPFHSVYSIAETLSVSQLIVLSHLRESFDMNAFHLRRIPYELMTNMREIRMDTCRELLPILKAHEKNKSQRSVAGFRQVLPR